MINSDFFSLYHFYNIASIHSYCRFSWCIFPHVLFLCTDIIIKLDCIIGIFVFESLPTKYLKNSQSTSPFIPMCIYTNKPDKFDCVPTRYQSLNPISDIYILCFCHYCRQFTYNFGCYLQFYMLNASNLIAGVQWETVNNKDFWFSCISQKCDIHVLYQVLVISKSSQYWHASLILICQ